MLELINIVVDPFFDGKSGDLASGFEDDDCVYPGIDDHSFADFARFGIGDNLPGLCINTHQVEGGSEHVEPGGVNDGILFRMHAPADFVFFPLLDVQLLSGTKANFRAIPG